MKRDIIKYLKAKRNLSNEIKNLPMEEKIKEIDEIYENLKEIPNDIDIDLIIQNIKVAEEVYYQAKASGVQEKYLKNIEGFIKEEKEKIKSKKKDNNNELDKLFEDINTHVRKINNEKFVWKKGEIKFIDSVCDECIYQNKNNKNKCAQYPKGKPDKVLKNEILCSKEKSDDILK